MTEDEYQYDVALSFAGEQRRYVDETAAELVRLGIRVFYDDYEKADLWGKDLYSHLGYVHQKKSHILHLLSVVGVRTEGLDQSLECQRSGPRHREQQAGVHTPGQV